MSGFGERLLGARPWGRGDWGLYVAVALVSTAVGAAALQVWAADWTVPWSDVGDAIPTAAHFKTVFETGWYEFNPLLSAPFGQQYHDMPTAENTNFFMALVLGGLTGSWAVAMNLYFLLGFPLAALAAAWFIRVAGGSGLVTLATATVYGILPFHFLQGEPHLFISSYYVIPLGAVLALRAARGETLWGWRRGTAHPVGRWFGRGLQTVAVAVVVGSTDTYYAAFILLILAAAGILAVIRDRHQEGHWDRFWGAVGAAVLIVAVAIANMLPDQIYQWVHGENEGAFVRWPGAAETYALKFVQLLLPWPGHRIGPLADLRNLYDQNYGYASEYPAIGAISAIGMLFLFGLLIVRAFGAVGIGAKRAATPRRQTLGVLAALTFVAFLCSTLGGIDSLIALITPALRSWNRMAVVIALFALAAVTLLVDAAIGRAVRRWSQDGRRPLLRPILGAIAAALLIVVAYIDQTPGSIDYASGKARFQAYQDFFGQVEASLQPGDWVVQLPNQVFPEAIAPSGSNANDVVQPYLYTEHIGWSGGGIKGRIEADWPANLDALGPERIPTVAAAAGASGILVDWIATPEADRGTWAAEYQAQLGAPLRSADDRYWFWTFDAVPQSAIDAVTPAQLAELLDGREWAP